MKRLVFAVVLALCASPSFAAQLEVGAGQTYTTIQSCINAMAAGDTCNVHAGTYTEQLTASSGTVGNIKRVQCHAGDTVTVQSTSSPVLDLNGADYFTLDCVHITYNGSGAAPRGVSGLSGSSVYVTFNNLTITIAGGTGSGFGINIQPGSGGTTDHLTLQNVTVAITSTTGAMDGMQILYTTNLLINGCHIYGNASESTGKLQDGIVVTGDDGTITDCLLEDGWQFDGHPDAIVIQGDGTVGGSSSGGAHRWTIARNRIVNFGSAGIYPDAIWGDLLDIVIINNTMTETPSFRYGGNANKMNCMDLHGENAAGNPGWNLGIKVYNNVFDCGQVQLKLTDQLAGNDIEIRNNIFINPNYSYAIYSDQSDTAGFGISANYNYYAGGDTVMARWNNVAVNFATFQGSPYNQEANGLRVASTTTLDLTDVANYDYTPKATSDSNNRGVDLSATFTTDFLGLTRAAPWDMGAYEYGAGATGTQRFSPGINLRRASADELMLVSR
jgi:hypothetical protein